MRIAVDLTPLLPGGENGGAKPMVLALLQHLIALHPDWSFVLLTAAASHDELAFLDGPRVERRCVMGPHMEDAETPSWAYRMFRKGYRWMRHIVPERWLLRWKRWYYRWRWTPRTMRLRRTLLEEVGADLLFAPFTAPFFHDPRVPLVTVVYDLQFMDYPQFFTPEERAHRQRTLSDALRLATHVVTISEFVRQTVLERFPIAPERVTAIPIGLPRPLPQLPEPEARAWLRQQGLRPGGYLLYPANFWPHKNHEALFVAFRLLRERLPDAEVHLVLTGALEHRRRFLMQAAQQMGLAPWVKLPGFVPEAQLGTLYAHALGLVFPSLYEGFGIPVLEAMAMGVPVACSRVASLPEVVGEAALFFDPRSPEQIAAAMARLIQDPRLRQDLVRRGQERVRRFGGAQELAERYAGLFEQVVQRQAHITRYELASVTPDGWLEAQSFFLFPQGEGHRVLELRCELPSWVPFPVTLRVQEGRGGQVVTEQRLHPGERATWQIPLPASGGYWRLLSSPPFRPQEWGGGQDARELGPRCLGVRVLTLQGEKKVLWALP